MAKTCAAQTLRLDALGFASLGQRNSFRSTRCLNGTSNIASRPQSGSLLLNECGDPSLRVGRSEAFAVTIFQESEQESRREDADLGYFAKAIMSKSLTRRA
jgi:hypothetical protein